MFPISPVSTKARTTSLVTGTGCPLREGAATLDALLAEIGPQGGEALDLALDLRVAAHTSRDATACLDLMLRLRQVLGESHYLALYRVRLWLAGALAFEVRAHRGDTWVQYTLPLQANLCTRASLEQACVSRWAQDGGARGAGWAQCRVVWRGEAEATIQEQPV